MMPLGRCAVIGVSTALLLGGCAASVTPVPTNVDVPGMPNPEQALRQSIEQVDAQMASLGRIAPSRATLAPVVPAELHRVVSFTWAGSLDKGVAKLAQSIGYTFYATASPNAQPIDVAVQAQSEPAIQVFKSLGDAAGNRATVEVDTLHHQVQVIHHV